MSVITPIGAAFLHIPKTGGTSVVKWLNQNIIGCTQLKAVHPKLSSITTPNIDFVFTVVRNPWARMVSFYNYTSQRHASGIVQSNVSTSSFEDFVYGVLDRPIDELEYQVKGVQHRYWFTLSTPQTHWMDGKVDVILKTETLNEDFKLIQRELGCANPLGVENKSSDGTYTQMYNSDTRKYIAKMFESDIDMFGYTFI